MIKTFFLFGATSGRIEAAAEGGSAGDTEEGGGFGGIEDGIGLGVAFTAGGTLNPDNIASGVEDHVGVLGRRSDPESREVLAASLGESRDY